MANWMTLEQAKESKMKVVWYLSPKAVDSTGTIASGFVRGPDGAVSAYIATEELF